MLAFEQKYCMGTKDRKYHIFWDIGAILQDMQTTQFPITHCNVADLFKNNPFFGNIEYAINTDISIPCIVVSLNNDKNKLIDGNHRLYKSKQLGCENIPCYILPLDYHTRFIIDYDVDIYRSVIADFTI